MATPVAAEELAHSLAGQFLRPETCREAAAVLPGRPSPDEVGCCEIAFARAAVVQHVIAEALPASFAEPTNAALAREIADAFGGAHTAATEVRYGAQTLTEAAAEALTLYRPAAFFGRRLSEMVMARLGLVGRPPAALIKGFADLTEAVVKTLARAGLV